MAITDGFKVFLQILTQVHVSNNRFTSIHTPEYTIVLDFYKIKEVHGVIPYRIK